MIHMYLSSIWTAHSVVPRGTNLVAVLVPGGPNLGGGKFGMTGLCLTEPLIKTDIKRRE